MPFPLMARPLVLVTCFSLLLLLSATNSSPTGNLNNVVLIIADDLSPFYLDEQHPAKMPYVRQLAKRGVHFVNAHSSFPVCGPSRMSFMTGRYADSTKLFTFERHVPEVTGLNTMAQYLANNHGYEAVSFGKVFHDDPDLSDPLSMALFQGGLWTQRQFGGGSSDMSCGRRWYCNILPGATGDFQLSRRFVTWMKHRNASKPLFAAVGFRKPHLDVGIPSHYSSPGHYDAANDTILTTKPSSLGINNQTIPFEKSLQMFDCYYEIARRKVDKVKAYPPGKFLTPKHSKQLRSMRRYYFAAHRFVDEMIGHVLNYIESAPAYQDNTAVIFISDHGFAHGEHGMFCKNALFDQQSRVAFVASPAQRVEAADRGLVRTDPVDLVHVFPTVVHMAVGVELPWNSTVDESQIPLDGRSVLQSDRAVLSVYAFSQYPRCDSVSRKANWQCVIATNPCGRKPNIFMGYTVRTVNTRYVEWRHFQDVMVGCERPYWPGLNPSVRKKLRSVKVSNISLTGTNWTALPEQRELFKDYPETPDFRWGMWELDNSLVLNIGDNAEIVTALELSSAIRWRFDPSFNGQAGQPCSGNGYVRLKDSPSWFTVDVQPSRAEVYCECLSGWDGTECEIAL